MKTFKIQNVERGNIKTVKVDKLTEKPMGGHTGRVQGTKHTFLHLSARDNTRCVLVTWIGTKAKRTEYVIVD